MPSVCSSWRSNVCQPDRWHNGEDSGSKYLGWEQLFTSKRYPGNKLVDYWLNDDNAAKWGAA